MRRNSADTRYLEARERAADEAQRGFNEMTREELMEHVGISEADIDDYLEFVRRGGQR